MYKVMEKHSKKLMAVFAALLMIVFVIPSNNRGNHSASDTEVGQIGKQLITQDQLIQVHNEWQILRQQAVMESGQPNPQTGEPEIHGLAEQLGPYVVDQIDKHPVMFLLLLREAQQNGVSVSDRALSSLLSAMQVNLKDGRRVDYDVVKGDEIGAGVRQSAHDLLMIRNGFEQSEQMIKISQPLLNNRLAKTVQELKLELVTFDGKDYASQVAAPTTQQLTDQFNKYADNFAGVTDPKTNPAGYGYKYPDRVKLAYISIPHDELRKAVIASQTDDQWQVKEWRYYHHNLSEFPTTSPTTGPTTEPLSISLTKPAGPTTRPFAEVQSQILDDLVNPDAEKLGQTIVSRIAVQMRDDWSAYHSAATATPPTTMPVTSVGVAYDSPNYFPKLSAQIQSEFKVIPAVANLSEKFLSAKDLQTLPGIGKSTLVLGPENELPLQAYAIGYAAPLQPPNAPRNDNVLDIFEPSRPLSDYNDTYIFRLTAVDPAHKPATLAEVQPQVEQDVRSAEAVTLAQANAQSVLVAAQKSTLGAAAAAAKKTISDTGYISLITGLGTNPPVSTDGQKEFFDQAFDLLNLAAENKKPMELISVPQDQKVFVSQLVDVRRISQLASGAIEPRISQEITQELGRNLYLQWFNYDNVTQRADYKSLDKKGDSEG